MGYISPGSLQDATGDMRGTRFIFPSSHLAYSKSSYFIPILQALWVIAGADRYIDAVVMGN